MIGLPYVYTSFLAWAPFGIAKLIQPRTHCLGPRGVTWSAGNFADTGSRSTVAPLLSFTVKNEGIASVPFGVWALVQIETSALSSEPFDETAYSVMKFPVGVVRRSGSFAAVTDATATTPRRTAAGKDSPRSASAPHWSYIIGRRAN